MHIIQQMFGEGCCLYNDVLNCEKDADKAALRKAYYRTALKFHPDKNPGDASAAANFQAVTAAYHVLSNVELRAVYDESGIIPDDDPDIVDGENSHWKDYFDRIFGKVTLGDIEAFAAKYKCSDEEKRDVLKEYIARKGNLEKMLEFVMLSEPRDAQRWVEDYIRPAIDAKEVCASYSKCMEMSLKKLQKKVEKQAKRNGEKIDDDESTDEVQRKRHVAETAAKKASAKQSQSPKKGKPTNAKRKSKQGMTDLIAQIQNKKRGGASVESMVANLGARYGVAVHDDDEDPLNDKEFETIRSKLKGEK